MLEPDYQLKLSEIQECGRDIYVYIHCYGVTDVSTSCGFFAASYNIA